MEIGFEFKLDIMMLDLIEYIFFYFYYKFTIFKNILLGNRLVLLSWAISNLALTKLFM